MNRVCVVLGVDVQVVADEVGILVALQAVFVVLRRGGSRAQQQAGDNGAGSPEPGSASPRHAGGLQLPAQTHR